MSSQQDLARAHVIRGLELVAEQRKRIAWLKSRDCDRSLSESMLRTFEDTLAIFEADLLWLTGEVVRREASAPNT